MGAERHYRRNGLLSGLKLLSPHYFYASTALICAVIALGIGSSWTVAGTIGIGLMGVAANMGLSPAITAGAIISGAYFGDKASPLSDTVNLGDRVCRFRPVAAY